MSMFLQVFHFWRYQITFSIQRVYRYKVFFVRDEGDPRILMNQFDELETAKAYCTPLANRFKKSFDEFELQIIDMRTGAFVQKTYQERTKKLVITEFVESEWVEFN